MRAKRVDLGRIEHRRSTERPEPEGRASIGNLGRAPVELDREFIEEHSGAFDRRDRSLSIGQLERNVRCVLRPSISVAEGSNT